MKWKNRGGGTAIPYGEADFGYFKGYGCSSVYR